jgi:hypothetical protein
MACPWHANWRGLTDGRGGRRSGAGAGSIPTPRAAEGGYFNRAIMASPRSADRRSTRQCPSCSFFFFAPQKCASKPRSLPPASARPPGLAIRIQNEAAALPPHWRLASRKVGERPFRFGRARLPGSPPVLLLGLGLGILSVVVRRAPPDDGRWDGRAASCGERREQAYAGPVRFSVAQPVTRKSYMKY